MRPRAPHLNGKVERSHRIDDQEFYQLLDQGGVTDDIHRFNEKLREWEDRVTVREWRDRRRAEGVGGLVPRYPNDGLTPPATCAWCRVPPRDS